MNTQHGISDTRSVLEREAKPVRVGSTIFDVSDPSDGAGIRLGQYGLCQTYQADSAKVEQICEDLYLRVQQKIKGGGLGADARTKLVQYSQDIRSRNGATFPDKRFYIIVKRDTLRSTRASILLRFEAYGSNLYLAIDSYVLGDINWKAFFKRIFITLLVVFFALPVLLAVPALLASFVSGSVGSALSGSAVGFFLSVGSVAWLWLDVIKRVAQNKGNIGLSLRQAFSKEIALGTFNYDDVMMFLKSTLLISVLEVRNILKKEGFDVETLDGFVQSINISNTFNAPVNTAIANVEGSANIG